MSGLFAPKTSGAAPVTQLASLQVSSSTFGNCIPVVYGTTRIAWNLIDYDDFYSQANYTDTGGGKGLDGGHSQVSSYNYYAGIIAGVCHGPIGGIGMVWSGTELTTASAMGLSIYPGDSPGAAWPIWASKHPSKALPYSGLSYVCHPSLPLGSSGGLPNINLEVHGVLSGGFNASSISVPGTAMPWAGYATSGTSPVNIPVTGPWVQISASGTININGGVSGYTVTPAGSGAWGWIGNWVDAPFAALVGAWINSSGAIIKKIFIGIGGTFQRPANAVAITIGVNDFNLPDNIGSFLLSISMPTVMSGKAFPPSVITDMLTNPIYGIGWRAGAFANFSSGAASYGNFCGAMAFGISGAFTDQADMASQLGKVLDATHAELSWHATTADMALDVRPYCAWPISGNGYTYTPNTSPVFDIVDDDFLGVVDENGNVKGQAIKITTTAPSEIYNSHPVEYMDATNEYNLATAQNYDQADASLNGPKVAGVSSMRLITDGGHAGAISSLKNLRSIYVRNKYEFKLGWCYSLFLEPFDLLTLTNVDYGMTALPVMIISIDTPAEGMDEAEGCTIAAEDWPLGVLSPTLYGTNAGDSSTASGGIGSAGGATASGGIAAPTGQTTDVDPGDCLAPYIYTPPTTMTGGTPQVWIGTSGREYWGGCYVWVSSDGGASYQRTGQITQRARYGTLAADLPSVADPDTSSTLAVMLSDASLALASASASAAAGMATLCDVAGEAVTYQTATMTGAGAYALTTLGRGKYNTTPAAAAAGAGFARLDDAFFKYSIPPNLIHSTFFIKLQSYNIFGSGAQDLSAIDPISVFLQQSIPSPSNVTIAVSSSKPTVNSGDFALGESDWRDGVSYGGGNPSVNITQWITITWSWPGDNPDYFDILATNGANPTDESTWIFEPISVPGNIRRAVIAITPSSVITSVYASIRAVNE